MIHLPPANHHLGEGCPRGSLGSWCHPTFRGPLNIEVFPDRKGWVSGLIGVTLLSLLGCKTTVEDIQTWKTTVKGGGKIKRAIEDTGNPVKVRQEAICALAELGSFDALDQAIKSLNKPGLSSITSMPSNGPTAKYKTFTGSEPKVSVSLAMASSTSREPGFSKIL